MSRSGRRPAGDGKGPGHALLIALLVAVSIWIASRYLWPEWWTQFEPVRTSPETGWVRETCAEPGKCPTRAGG